jgi:hypothetical protein
LGVASVELAVLTPFLCFLFVVATDFARSFYYAVTVQNCARNGAYYAADYPNNNLYNDIHGYMSLDDAIMRDASNLSPSPTYTVYYGATEAGPFTDTTKPASGYVQVTVTWTFQSITNFPGIPSNVSLSRSAVMRIAPAMPNF